MATRANFVGTKLKRVNEPARHCGGGDDDEPENAARILGRMPWQELERMQWQKQQKAYAVLISLIYLDNVSSFEISSPLYLQRL